ncbi:MAG: type II toxin-antitoxin system VapC family toxin [Armatimonadetes bacterium]|nr:type II toxin-antitoxin system VapC family toxin [Armatimonadota bacterium]
MLILDTSAVLAYLYGEPGQDVVRRLLREAVDRRGMVRLHRIHLGEVYYVMYRKGGEAVAEAALRDVVRLPVRVEDRISPALMREAGRVKASYPVSYADAFAVALARIREGTLVSSDRELQRLEAAREVPVLWIR